MRILLQIDHVNKSATRSIRPHSRRRNPIRSAKLERDYLGYAFWRGRWPSPTHVLRARGDPAARTLVLVGRAEVLAELRPQSRLRRW